MQWHGRSVRKETGGRIRYARSKRRSEIGSAPADSHIGEERLRIIRTLGANQKVRVLRAQFANVANPKNGENHRVAIEAVEKNAADPNFVRRKILTKGAIIKTEIGQARIVSRPGQDGVINAVLI
ncbi:MAG: 30S ribosomal protein S8e [Methanomicrobiales archaeon]|jgi:small subunit ribosomal protein S8e|nr:30S ribosomal protein S8e [Methanomicrobiales archaeon]